MSFEIKTSKGTVEINLAPLIGGITFGIWVSSWLGGIAFAMLLLEVHGKIR